MLTHHAIAQAGELMFGPAFRKPLADALNINERTLRRYLAGTHDAPAGVLSDLAAMVRGHADQCSDAATELGLARDRAHQRETAA